MRALSERETRLLLKITRAIPDGETLIDQVEHAQVTDDSTPTFLHLQVQDSRVTSHLPDGPVQGRFPVTRNGEIEGELMVWVKGGWLSGLEFAWVTDVAPSEMPSPDDVGVGI
jgi:hypothetical protein